MFGISSFAGTIGTFTHMMKLQSRWNEKQEKGNYTEKSSLQEEDPIIRHLDEMRKQRQESSTKEAIISKMSTGKKLTREEMEYLKREDPAAYQKAKEIQDTQKGYKNALKNCKTKEDVQRLKSTHMGAMLTRVNAISNNPNIPDGQKMALLLHENAKMKAILKAEQEFVESGQYSQLPTDAEKKEAMKQEAEILREDRTEAPEMDQIVEETEESPAPGPDAETAGETEGAVPEEGKIQEDPSQKAPGSNQDRAENTNIRPVSPEERSARHKSSAGHAKGIDAYQQATSVKSPKKALRTKKISKRA